MGSIGERDAVGDDVDRAALAGGVGGGERSGVYDRSALGLDDHATALEDELRFGANFAAVVDGDGVDISTGGFNLGRGRLDDALIVDADFGLFASRIVDDDADALVANLAQFNLVSGGESDGPSEGADCAFVFDLVSKEENIASESVDGSVVFDGRVGVSFEGHIRPSEEALIRDIEGRRDKRLRVDGALRANKDSIGVDEIDLSVGLEGAEELRWVAAKHAIEHRGIGAGLHESSELT